MALFRRAGRFGNSFRNNQDLQKFVLTDVTPTGTSLGRGSYGSVEEVIYRHLPCAGKKLHEALLDVQNEGVPEIIQKYLAECQLMSSLRHPNIIQFLGIWFLPGTQLPLLVMEQLETSLNDLLEYIPHLSFALKQSVLQDVASGLLYLHKGSPPVIHRDLTAKNVLLTSHLQAKITDMGNSRIIDPSRLTQTLSKLPGTWVYMPPEALDNKHSYGPPLDVFSFGHLALFTVLQNFPGDLLPHTYPNPDNPSDDWKSRTELERREKYITDLEAVGRFFPSLVRLIKQCLLNAPDKRPSTDELLTRLKKMRSEMEGAQGGSPMNLDIMVRVRMAKEMKVKDRQIEKLTELLEQKGQAAEKCDRLREELRTKDAEISRLREELSEVAKGQEAEIYDNVPRTHDRMREELQTKDAEITRLREELSASSRGEAAKNVELEEKRRELEDTRKELEERTQDFREVTRELEEKTGAIDGLEAAVQERNVRPVEEVKSEVSGLGESSPASKGEVAAKVSEADIPERVQDVQRKKKLEMKVDRLESSVSAMGEVAAKDLEADIERDAQRREELKMKACRLMESHASSKGTSLKGASLKGPSSKRASSKGPSSMRASSKGPSSMRASPKGPSSKRASSLSKGPSSKGASTKGKAVPKGQTKGDLSLEKKPTLPLFLARDDFQGETKEALSLKKCEVISIISKDYKDWWYAESKDTGRKGFVPRNNVVAQKTPAVYVKTTGNSNPEIDRTQIRLKKRLCVGHLGEVWEGTLKDSWLVAVKKFKEHLLFDSDLLQEVTLMRQLRHPKVIHIYGACTKEEPVYFIMELMKESLIKYLHRYRDRRALRFPQLIDIATQVASGMAYLEKENYIHQKLSARNVLVGENGAYKVADFGLVRAIKDKIYESPDDVADHDHEYRMKWMAPEAALYNRYSIKSDVWSFGILVYEIITYGGSPYPDMTREQVLDELQTGYCMPCPPGCPDKLYRIAMLACWKDKPEDRPTFQSLHWQLDDYFLTDDAGYIDPDKKR